MLMAPTIEIRGRIVPADDKTDGDRPENGEYQPDVHTTTIGPGEG
jgi:hypothetical protein